MNFAKRPYKVFDIHQHKIEERMCVKMEKFFLDFYPLVQKQIFVEVEREDVS
jgi:hypothetical protein